MTTRTSTTCAALLALLMIGAGCGGSDTPESAPVAAGTVESDAASDGETPDSDSASEVATTAGFGELMEGSFVLSGAVDERYELDDPQLEFVTVGGCQGDSFGFGVHVRDAAGSTTFATFGAQGTLDLSGGATGEFDDVDFEVAVFPDGDMSLVQSYEGPIKMVITEHNTGGTTSDLNARRMTVSMSGSIPSDEGDLDVDINYRWVMGCP